MKKLQYDKEILYVQKMYFFIFLLCFVILASFILTWKLNLLSGIVLATIGIPSSYLTAFVIKRSFAPPDKIITAKRMAKEISHSTSPLMIARFASQLYFYLNDPKRAISLLEKYLVSQDPLVCATLGDIYLREKHPRRALSIVRDNPYALADPLLLAIQGHALRQLGRTRAAIKIYERCLGIAKQKGFPHNGTHKLTQWLLNLSYTASIHHALADCYLGVNDPFTAKKHYRYGNLRLLDITMWRFVKNSSGNSPGSYSKSH